MFSLKEENLSNVIQIQSNTHKASFKFDDLTNGCISKLNFTGKKASLFISVGRDYHEAGKFLSTIELINKYSFGRCDIVVADTLQRYNHFNRLGSDAITFSREAGDAWLERNKYAINTLKTPYKIIRWDELINHKDYAELKNRVSECYKNNAKYREAINGNVVAYIERLQALNPLFDKRQSFKNSLAYLIEECPIAMPLWAKLGYDFLIYPRSITPGMRMTRELFVAEEFPDKCQWLYLRFRKKTESK